MTRQTQKRGNKPATAEPPKVSAAEMKEHAADAAGLMKALGNESRLMILCLLAEGERSVGELNETVPLSLADLCSATGVGSSKLHQCFLDVIGVSPARFLYQNRLSRVRDRLLESSPG